MKNKQTAQPPTQQSAREVNTTYTTGHQQYCPMYPALNANQIHPSTLASAYYPNFLPAWRSSPSQQPPAGNYRSEASLTYINPKSPHITYLETNPPAQNQIRFEPPSQQHHMQQLPPPPPHNQPPAPKNEPNPENQVNPHGPLPTIGMILPIAGGSSMEFQTKKQKKDHLRLINNVAVQGPAKYTDWSRVPITFTEEDLQLESYPHTDAMVIKTNIAAWEISRVLIDTGSSSDIIFANTFDQMKLSRNQLQPSESYYRGF